MAQDAAARNGPQSKPDSEDCGKAPTSHEEEHHDVDERLGRKGCFPLLEEPPGIGDSDEDAGEDAGGPRAPDSEGATELVPAANCWHAGGDDRLSASFLQRWPARTRRRAFGPRRLGEPEPSTGVCGEAAAELGTAAPPAGSTVQSPTAEGDSSGGVRLLKGMMPAALAAAAHPLGGWLEGGPYDPTAEGVKNAVQELLGFRTSLTALSVETPRNILVWNDHPLHPHMLIVSKDLSRPSTRVTSPV